MWLLHTLTWLLEKGVLAQDREETSEVTWPPLRDNSQQKQRKDIYVRETTRKGICRKVNKTQSCFVEMEAVTKDNKHLVVLIIC